MDATLIIYSGLNLTHLGLSPQTNIDLDTILHAVDTHIGGGSAPDYSGYSLACVTQTDGITHPTNTQNFAEGISKILCDLVTSYNTFVGTTYVTNQATITAALNTINSPGLTYAPFSITNTDTLTQVYTKLFAGFTATTASITPASANWSTLSLSTQSTIVNAFNAIIAYEVGQDTLIAGKQASLGTFDTTAIGGTTGRTPVQAINTLITYVGTNVPEYDSSAITWGCVTSGGDLQSDIDNIIAKISTISSNYLADTSTGLTKTSIGSCLGYRVAINPAWVGLFKAAVDSSDAAGGTADYLENKFDSSDNTIDIAVVGTQIDLKVHTPTNNKVKLNSTSTAEYLVDKLPSVLGDWGLAVVPVVVSDQLLLKPTVLNPELFITNFITTIAADSDLLAQLCALIAQCSTCVCEGPTAFTVEITTI